MTMKPPEKKILYCHCAYAKVVPADVKQGVLEQLTNSDVAFDAVADLCEMSASKAPVLQQLAGQDCLQIAACYPRAVKWLFAAANAPLAEDRVEILNMRTDSAEDIVGSLLNSEAPTAPESDSEANQ